MTERLKGVLPLAAVIGVLAFLYVEFTLNFTFHWSPMATSEMDSNSHRASI